MDDKTLIELAAKAAGVTIKYNYLGAQDARSLWIPLEDDGEALRLAVALGIGFEMWKSQAWAWVDGEKNEPLAIENASNDEYAATRRAIVRAAAALAMPNVQGNRRMTAALSPAGVRLTAGFGVDCQTCGACCAYSFDWPELGEEPDGENIPLEMLDCEHGRMRCDGDRCCALEGDIGVAVRCVIYSNRPAVCREFAQEERFDDCNKVRAWHGLPPLTPNAKVTGA